MTREMNANDVLIDLLEDNRRRLHRFLDGLEGACLHWSPDGEANSVAVTVWHMGRLFDFFLSRQALGLPVEEQCWFRLGWAARTGYDPRGIGSEGWGTVNGYSAEDVAAMPRFDRATLLGYFDDVMDTVRAFLAETPMTDLQTAGAGFDGRFTKYQCIQMALLDNARHLGEIFALSALWQRAAGGSRAARVSFGHGQSS